LKRELIALIQLRGLVLQLLHGEQTLLDQQHRHRIEHKLLPVLLLGEIGKLAYHAYLLHRIFACHKYRPSSCMRKLVRVV